jgi:hypothetical protein
MLCLPTGAIRAPFSSQVRRYETRWFEPNFPFESRQFNIHHVHDEVLRNDTDLLH